jgi:apolipoprotein N-acyltransferase
MRSRMRRRIVAFAVAAVSALTIVGTTAATASALVRGHAAAQMNFGRGGVFSAPPSSGVDVAALIGGIAISAAIVALVVFVALRLDDRSRARPSLVSSGPSIEGSRPVSTEDHERKAA